MTQDESEIALRGTQRFLRQLIALESSQVEQEHALTISASLGGWRVETTGQQDNRVRFRTVSDKKIEKNEVLICVEAIGLSHYDVQRLLSQRKNCGLGLACAGTVIKIGSEVSRFKIGDLVWALSQDGCSGRLCVPEYSVAHLPSHLSFEVAATIPIPYLTALYLLTHTARIQPKESVLIQGFGRTLTLAIIQVANSLKAEVTVITDNSSDHALFQQLGVKELVSDRHLVPWQQESAFNSFDVVLNASTDSQAAIALSYLKPFGRFITLAKLDYAISSQLVNGKHTTMLNMALVDMEQVLAQPTLQRQLLANLEDFFTNKSIPTYTVETFPVSAISEAIKGALQNSREKQPVLVTRNDKITLLPSQYIVLSPEKAYLITGGASGLGLEIACWLVSRGGRHLVLVSRTGCKSASDQNKIQALQVQGVRVDMVLADVANSDELSAVFEQLKVDSITLGGIIHAAGVMDDGTIATMTPERFRYTLRPKAVGAWNLHKATCGGVSLEFFLLISSISSSLGMSATINYACSNRFMEALTDYRRANGQSSSTLALGVLGDYAGLSKKTEENQHMLELLDSIGLRRLRLRDVLNKIELSLIYHAKQRLAVKVDWQRYIKTHPHLAKEVRYQRVLNQTKGLSNQRLTGNLMDQLSSLPTEEAIIFLAKHLASTLNL
jgi:NADPH:quinone reductase-like Zn-dependent oxidoreductase